MKHRTPTAVGSTVLATLAVASLLALSACSSTGAASPTSQGTQQTQDQQQSEESQQDQESHQQHYTDDATFTFTLNTDPGALDPQLSALSVLIQLNQFAYDSLLGMDSDGEIQSQLAKDWSVDGTTVTLTLNDGITCSDGSPFTAETAAKNIAFVADPANQSPLLGAYLPVGVTATATGDTLTITLASPAPFVLQGLAGLPMVCDSGMNDRSTLTAGTAGTGPYVLSEAAANDHFTYQRNEAYAWGPGGITAKENGLPATVVARVIPNETTAVNLLLSGDVNAVAAVGPDAARAEAANLFSQNTESLLGETWYNQNDGHATADPAVRMALTQAVDLGELQKVLTSGKGSPATQLTVLPPRACNFDSVSGNVPATDVAAAQAALDKAGWVPGADGIREKDGKKLTLTLLHANSLGTGGTSAVELATAQWKAIGVEVDAQAQETGTITEALFGTGAWDIALVALNVSTPDQIVSFTSGAAAPDGTNFANIRNDEYSAGATSAMALDGTSSCDTWKEAESALFRAADVVPFANNVAKTFGNGAEFVVTDGIIPTSIRMLATS